jgi:predicted GIY-YIG superfamily endonuclease
MSKTTLYRIYDATDRLLYVGVTGNWFERVAQHANGKGWWDDVATIKVQAFDSRAEALAAETQAIRTEHPLHNVRHRRIAWVPASPEFTTMVERWEALMRERLAAIEASGDLDAANEHFEYAQSIYQWAYDKRADVMLAAHERLGASRTDMAEVTGLTRARVGQIIESAKARRERGSSP